MIRALLTLAILLGLPAALFAQVTSINVAPGPEIRLLQAPTDGGWGFRVIEPWSGDVRSSHDSTAKDPIVASVIGNHLQNRVSRFAVATESGEVQVFTQNNGLLLTTARFPDAAIRALAISPDNDFVAAAAAKELRFFSATTGREMSIVRPRAGEFTALANAPGRFFAATSTGEIQLFQMPLGSLLTTIYGEDVGVATMATGYHGLAVGYEDGTLRYFERQSCVLLQENMEGEDAPFTAITVMPTDEIISADKAGNIFIHDGITGSLLRKIELGEGYVTAFDIGNRGLAAGFTNDGWLLLVDVPSQSLLNRLQVK